MHNKRKISGPRPLIPGTNLATYPVNSTLLDPTGYNGLSRVFHNEGTDYVDCGRPSDIVDNIKFSDTYELDLVFNVVNLTVIGYLVSNQDTIDYTSSLLSVLQYENSIRIHYCGSRLDYVNRFTLTNGWHHLKFTTDGLGGYQLTFDGVKYSPLSVTGVAGPIVTTSNLYVGGRTDGATANWEGDISYFSFRNGSGVLLDTYDFTRADLWDGGATGQSVNGNAFTVTDGTPTGTLAYSAVPINLLPSLTNVTTVIKKQVFHNEGTDYLNCGRIELADLINDRSANHRITICTSFASVGYNVIVSVATNSSDRLFSVGSEPSGGINLWAGDSSSNYGTGLIQVGVYHTMDIDIIGTSISVYVDGVLAGSRVLGSGYFDTTSPFFIGACADGSSGYDGDMAYLKITDLSDGSLVDMYDFTNPNSMKEATSTFVSAKGNIGTFTDGTPTTAFNYALIPVDKLVPSYSRDYVLTTVGNFDNTGSTSFTDGAIIANSNIDLNSDFEIEIGFKHDTTDSVNFSRILAGAIDATGSGPTNRSLWVERGIYPSTAYTVLLHGVDNTIYSLGNVPDVIDNRWHLLKIVRAGDTIDVLVDGVTVISSYDVSGILLRNPTYFGVGGLGYRPIKGQLAYFRYNDQIKYLFNEGSGTVIYNRFSNLYNATLTDGSPATFWSVKDAVPSSMR